MRKNKTVAELLKNCPAFPEFDEYYANQARSRQDQLTKPPGSLGKLEELAIWMAGWQRKTKPTMENVNCLVFAGNH